MKSATLGQLLEGALDNDETMGLVVYLVRAGETPLFIGWSKRDAISQMLNHLGRGWWSWGGPSWLSSAILANLPEAYRWRAEFWTLEECAAALGQPCHNEKDAARKLIQELGPCLNSINNPNPQDLPEGYRLPYEFDIYRVWPRLPTPAEWVDTQP